MGNSNKKQVEKTINVNIFNVNIHENSNIKEILKKFGSIPRPMYLLDEINAIPTNTCLLCLKSDIDINEFCNSNNFKLCTTISNMNINNKYYNNKYRIDEGYTFDSVSYIFIKL